MAAPRMHYYMATAQLSYVRDDTNKSRLMNLVVATPERRLNITTLNEARNSLIARLTAESEVPKSDLKDFVFTNISYLGHMTDREFQDAGAPTVEAPAPYPN